MSKQTKPQQAAINEGIQANEIKAQAVAVGRGARAVVTNNASDTSDDVRHIFLTLINRAATLPEGPERMVAQNAIEGLQAEAQKGEEAKEDNVNKWLSFLAQAAPDIWEVAVASFLNPIQGLSLVFQKVAQRAKST